MLIPHDKQHQSGILLQLCIFKYSSENLCSERQPLPLHKNKGCYMVM